MRGSLKKVYDWLKSGLLHVRIRMTYNLFFLKLYDHDYDIAMESADVLEEASEDEVIYFYDYFLKWNKLCT